MNGPSSEYLLTPDGVTVPSGTSAMIRRLLAAWRDFDEAARSFPFRKFVREELPDLERIGAAAVGRLETGSRFVVLKGLPYANYELPMCKFLLLALAVSLGRPRPTYEYSNNLVWEVKTVAELPPGHVPTVTEHSYEAEPHTDSSFKKHPERYMALFVVRPARSGGLSEIVDGRILLERLKCSAEGAACLTVLSSEFFPFRRPTTFTRSRREDKPEWIVAPVVSEVPVIRYRYDVIERGFECASGANTPERRQAIEIFRNLVTDAPKTTVGLEAGDLLLINNHEILHGRTAFEDENRLLLRVRMDADEKTDGEDVAQLSV